MVRLMTSGWLDQDLSVINYGVTRVWEFFRAAAEHTAGVLSDHWGVFWILAIGFGMWCLAGHMLRKP